MREQETECRSREEIVETAFTVINDRVRKY